MSRTAAHLAQAAPSATTDESALDAIASVLAGDWDDPAGKLADIAGWIACTNRPHPGRGDRQTYAATFTATTGRILPNPDGSQAHATVIDWLREHAAQLATEQVPTVIRLVREWQHSTMQDLTSPEVLTVLIATTRPAESMLVRNVPAQMKLHRRRPRSPEAENTDRLALKSWGH